MVELNTLGEVVFKIVDGVVEEKLKFEFEFSVLVEINKKGYKSKVVEFRKLLSLKPSRL